MNAERSIGIVIIGGSGAYNFSEGEFGHEFDRITVQTPFGPSGPFRIMEIDGENAAFLSRHGEKGYHLTAPYVNYRANIYAAKELGAQRILSWSGPGAIHEAYSPGDLILPDDLIDLTRSRPSTFFEDKGIGFIRQNPVFCPKMRKAFGDALQDLGHPVHSGGTYVCTEGPRLETPAEIRFMKQMGGDLVGMTLVPETFLARELEMCYAPLCYISNYAEGIRTLPYEKGILFEGTLPEKERHRVEQTLALFPEIIKTTLRHLVRLERTCPCPDAMLRYRVRGDIGDDWHSWIG
jgi:5'-methylthioadenosine phosphorylase